MDRYLADLISTGKAPSVAVAVVRNGKVVYAKGFGFADLENNVPAAPHTVYRLGSITKQFTATMIMQLVYEGKLRLDELVISVLPDSPKGWAKVTVRNLLNHTSGIKSYTEIPGIFADAALKPVTPAGILKTVNSFPLDFEPGSAWHYDNSGYEVLGLIIEKLDARKYEASLRARILKPLGMSETYFTSERTVVKGRAQGYSPMGTGFQHALYLNMGWPYAAGSMESTVLDLAKWDAALYGDAILPQASLNQMWTKTVLTNGKVQAYGFGWSLGTIEGVQLVEHGGGIHGFTTFIRRAPSKALTVIVLSNSDAAPSQDIATKVMGLADATLRVMPAKPIKDDAPAKTKLARETMQSILDDKLDTTKFTPEFAKTLTPDLIKGAAKQFGALGKLTRFELTSGEAKNGFETRTYRMTLGTTDFLVTVVIDKDGLISNLDVK